MGSSKKANRKQTEIPLIKIKAFDTVFEPTEDVPKNKTKMAVHDIRENALETTGKHAKLCEREKKRKSERFNTLANNDLVEESLEKTEGNSFSTPLKVTGTILNITSKLDPEFKVHGNTGVALQTTDNTVEGNTVSKRIKSKKKKHNEFQNTDRNENFMETMKHLDKTLSFSEISDLNLSTDKKSNENPMHSYLIAVEPSTSSKCDTNSMRKSNLTTEINIVSAGKSSLITYLRKKKKLSHSEGKQLLLSKEEPPSSSLQDERNSSKEEVTVNYSNDVLRQMDSKGKAKSENVNCEGNLDVAEKVKRQMGSFAEFFLETSSSNNKLQKVKERKPMSCNVIQNNATGGVYVDSLDKELAPGKRREKEVMKLMQSNSGDGIPKYIFKSDGCDENLVDENVSELSQVHVTLKEGGISVEESIEESKKGCKKDKCLVSVETGDIKHGDSVELCNKGCRTSSPVVENVAVGDSYINSSKKRTASRRCGKMELKHTHDERKASDTPSFPHTPKQPEQLEQAGTISSEVNPTENAEREIVPLPSTENVIKAGLINKEYKPFEFLPGEGNSSLLPSGVDIDPKQPEGLEEHQVFSEDNPNVKVSYISDEEIPDVTLSEREKELVTLSSSKSDVKASIVDGGDKPIGLLTKGESSSLLPAVEDVFLCKSSAKEEIKMQDESTSKRKRTRWRDFKNKRDKKRKMLLREVTSSLLPAVDYPHPKLPEDLKRYSASNEDNPKGRIEIPEVSLGDHKNEEAIPLSSSNSDIKDVLFEKGDDPFGMFAKEGCSSLLPAVEDVSLGKNSASNLVPKSSRRVRRKKRKDVKHTANEDKASENTSVCDLPAKQPESVPVMEDYPPLGEKILEVEAVHVSGVENLDISRNTCQMEGRTLANGDVTKDAIVGSVNEEDNHLNISSALPVRAPISCTRRKLLVLDLNGILVDIVSDVPRGYRADTRIARKALFKRPFCDDFLKFCFENFHVGVWSSRMKRNVDSVVDFLMRDTRNKLLFCWDQSHCTETGVGTIENRQKPLVLKELKKLWSKHEQSLPWEKGMYDESNTLLLDDSPYKALRNPPHTAIFPRSYTFQDTDDNSLGPGGDLRVYLEGLVTAENVQEYVKQHPFGQRAITNKNPSWAFYLRIIGVNNVPTQADINSSTTHLQMGTTS